MIAAAICFFVGMSAGGLIFFVWHAWYCLTHSKPNTIGEITIFYSIAPLCTFAFPLSIALGLWSNL